MLYQNYELPAIFVRVLGVLALCSAFYFKRKWNSPLFYASLIFSTIGEVLVQLGSKSFHHILLVAFTIYYWLVFFLIKRNVREPKYKIKSDRIVPIVITVSFIFYLVVSVFIFVFDSMVVDVIFPVICTVAFLVTVFYMGFIYISIRTTRNLWLLLAMMIFIICYASVPLEGLLFNSDYFKGFIILSEVLSHFFIYKFLVTPEHEIEPDDKTLYL